MWRAAGRAVGSLAPGLSGGMLRMAGIFASLTDRELEAKLRVFESFDRSRGRPEIPSADGIHRLAARGGYEALWEMEGMGYRWGSAVLRDEGADPTLLRAADLPEGSLLALHTGAGMAFADRCLTRCPAGCHPAVFLDLCAGHARPGWTGAMEETLGLVVRTLRPELLETFDAHLGEGDAVTLARFWHGVGRGLYFAPTNHLPWREPIREAVDKALREPPHELGGANAAAGLAWAVALVHVARPERVRRLAEALGRSLPAAAVDHGLAGARAVWACWTGTGPLNPGPGKPEDLFHVAPVAGGR